MRTASVDALDYAEIVARRVHGRAAPVRRLFVERALPDSPPPLATLLRGGRGGEVRLKLYLSILWFAGGPPLMSHTQHVLGRRCWACPILRETELGEWGTLFGGLGSEGSWI